MGRRRGLFVSVAVVAAAALVPRPAMATVPAGFVDEAVASVSAPTAIAFTPDGRMLVTTQPGQLQVRPAPYSSATTALDLSALPGAGSVVCTTSERGLLGIAVDPEFAANRFVYLYYTFNGPSGCKNRVARFVLPDSNTVDPASQVVLVDNIHSTAGNHNAGDVHFGRDGYLYVTVGDGAATTRATAAAGAPTTRPATATCSSARSCA
jgi:glucose/arabinose dehydrogenase